MTRIEHLFEPHIVQAVYARMDREAKEREVMEAVSRTHSSNIVSMSAYRQRIVEEGGKVVS